MSTATNTIQQVQVIIYVNDMGLDRFSNNPNDYMLLTEGGDPNIPTGVLIAPVTQADSGVKVHCQVASCTVDGTSCSGLGINSTTAVLIVAGKCVAAITLVMNTNA